MIGKKSIHRKKKNIYIYRKKIIINIFSALFLLSKNFMESLTITKKSVLNHFYCTQIVSRFYSKQQSIKKQQQKMNRSVNSIETYSNIPSLSSSNPSAMTKSSKSLSSKSSSFVDFSKQRGGGVAAAAISQSNSINVDYVGDFLKHTKLARDDSANNRNLISISMDSISDLLLETGIFVAGLKNNNNNNNNNNKSKQSQTSLSIGDRIVSINGVSLANKSLSNLSAKFFQNLSRFNLLVQKMAVQKSSSSLNLTSPSRANKNYFLTYEKDQPLSAHSSRAFSSSVAAVVIKNSSKNSIFNDVMSQLNCGGKQQLRSGETGATRTCKYPGAQSKQIDPLYDVIHHDGLERGDLVKRLSITATKGDSDDLIKNFQEFNRKEKHLNFDHHGKRSHFLITYTVLSTHF